MTDGLGTPVSLVHTGANRPDHESLEPLLEKFAGVVRYKRGRPKRKFEALYADSAYAVTPCYKAVNERNMEAKFVTKSRAGEHLGKKRWPVERTFAWFDGYRKIRIRDARQLLTWNALHQIAAFCIAWKQLLRFC